MQAKRQYYHTTFNRYSNDLKKTWQTNNIITTPKIILPNVSQVVLSYAYTHYKQLYDLLQFTFINSTQN